jgi:hypothetical protein
MTTFYNEATDFLAAGMTPEELLAFRPSMDASRRFEELVAKEKHEGLLPDEADDLERMMEIERVLSLVKAKARLRLSQQNAQAQ